MIISTIVAKAKNNVIGKDNDIPWYLPADLKYFKKITTGHHILMGRKCFQSIGKPLPKRTNVIITQNPFFLVSNCYIANSVEESLQIAHDNGEEEAMIIGGGQIYELTKHLWDRMYITEVEAEIDGDIYFPVMNMENWELSSKKDHKKDEKNEFDYSFQVYNKK
jgi:dihydrofolate reductase